MKYDFEPFLQVSSYSSTWPDSKKSTSIEDQERLNLSKEWRNQT